MLVTKRKALILFLGNYWSIFLLFRKQVSVLFRTFNPWTLCNGEKFSKRTVQIIMLLERSKYILAVKLNQVWRCGLGVWGPSYHYASRIYVLYNYIKICYLAKLLFPSTFPENRAFISSNFIYIVVWLHLILIKRPLWIILSIYFGIR